MGCFIWPALQNTKIFNVLLLYMKKTSKYSHTSELEPDHLLVNLLKWLSKYFSVPHFYSWFHAGPRPQPAAEWLMDSTPACCWSPCLSDLSPVKRSIERPWLSISTWTCARFCRTWSPSGISWWPRLRWLLSMGSTPEIQSIHLLFNLLIRFLIKCSRSKSQQQDSVHTTERKIKKNTHLCLIYA